MFSDNDQRFLGKVKRTIRLMPYILLVAVIVLVVLLVYFLVYQPMLINPYYAAEQANHGAIDDSVKILFFVFTPIALCLDFVMLAVFIAYSFSNYRKDRKLLELLEKAVSAKSKKPSMTI